MEGRGYRLGASSLTAPQAVSIFEVAMEEKTLLWSSAILAAVQKLSAWEMAAGKGVRRWRISVGDQDMFEIIVVDDGNIEIGELVKESNLTAEVDTLIEAVMGNIIEG